LGSGLKEYNLLQKGTTVSVFHKRQIGLSSYFAMEDSLCYCNYVDGLLDALGKKNINQKNGGFSSTLRN
jgi:hypothetical protein